VVSSCYREVLLHQRAQILGPICYSDVQISLRGSGEWPTEVKTERWLQMKMSSQEEKWDILEGKQPHEGLLFS
jgi:hypothetical protein